MKKISVSIIIMVILIFTGSQILIESDSILKSVSFSFNIWKNNIFPSLFPFFVLSELLINYGFVELLSELFKPIMNYLFKVKGVCAFIFIMSIISGIPANAKYIRELHLNKDIYVKRRAKQGWRLRRKRALPVAEEASLRKCSNCRFRLCERQRMK